jgi:hypothetical protein
MIGAKKFFVTIWTGKVLPSARSGVPKERLASAYLVFDEQSFSSGGGDAAGQSGGRNEMAFRNLHHGCKLQHKLSGHLFAGRYKSLLIDEATPGYPALRRLSAILCQRSIAVAFTHYSKPFAVRVHRGRFVLW